MRIKRVITTILIACLLLFGFERARAVIWQCIVAVVVITTGVIIAIKLKKLCDKLPKVENPEKPPACPTNPPPVARFSMAASELSLPVLEIDDNAVEYYDVSDHQFENADPNGNPYTKLFRTSVQSSSSPAGPWQQQFKLIGWISQSYVLTVFYTNGVPVITNASTMTGASSTNKVALPIDMSAPSRFFRGATP